MKLKNTFLLFSLVITGFTSCVSENLENEQTVEKGRMTLRVSALEPMTTRAKTEVTNYPVIVYDKQGNIVEGCEWETVSDIPEEVVLKAGKYDVESHTPGTCEKRMSTPYYKGVTEIEIIKNTRTDVEVICKMLNSKIQMTYTPEFLEVFKTWTITIDDSQDLSGANSVFSFTDEDGTTPDPFYWYFQNEVTKLKLNFQGVTTNGSTIVATRIITKSIADERYDDDAEYFKGGDALAITLSPTGEVTSGKVNDITINATITFAETTEPKDLEVTDNNSGNNEEPSTPPTEAITLTLPQDMTVTEDTDPSLGDALILTPNGIKSLLVSIESTNSEMTGSLEQVAIDYPGLDFINGTEVVGSTILVNFLAELGEEITVPSSGQTEYTFPIGNFFGFLLMLEGTHTFHMIVEDLNGNKKQGTINLTI